MRQTVSADLGDSAIKDNDIKVDTTPQNAEEKETQEKVVEVVENKQEATVSESVAEKTDEVVETQPTGEKEEVSPDNYGKVIDTEEEVETKEEKKEEVDIEKIKEQAKREAFDEFINKYKPNEQKSENIRLYKQNEQLNAKLKEQSINDYLTSERQTDIYQKFCDNHKDIIPEQSKKNLIAYQTIGDENLIANDDVLFRLDKELKKFAQVNPENPLVDLGDRLESALWLAFKDDIISNKTKQIQAKIEMEKQKADKAVEDGSKSNNSTKSTIYTSEQQKVAEAWGVKLS